MANYKITERIKKDKNGNSIKYNCIVADLEKMTETEKEAVQMYLKAGYKLYPKKIKKQTGKGLTKQKMIDYLQENNKEALQVLENKFKNKDNFMNITKWFRQSFPEAKDI